MQEIKILSLLFRNTDIKVNQVNKIKVINVTKFKYKTRIVMGGWFVGIVTVNQLVDVKVVTYINNLSELINW